MSDFVDIFSRLDIKIAETLSFEPTITTNVKLVEARSSGIREYGDGGFQPLIEALGSDLPAIVTGVLPAGATGDNTTTGMDQYLVPCGVVTVVNARTKQAALALIQKIIYYVENKIRSQKSAAEDFNGHGGITMESPITTFEYTVYNNKHYYIATTEFKVLTIEEFDIS